MVAAAVAWAFLSLRATEASVLAAAEAEGRALLAAVSAGVARNLEASRAVERLLADRLLVLGRALGEELAAAPGQEERLLRAFAGRNRLKGALLLDPSFGVLASSGGGPGPPGAPGSPVSADRLAPLVAEDLVRRARDRGLGERPEVSVGFGESLFGSRVEFLVGLALPEGAGFLLLRQDADDLRSLREAAGVERLLRETAVSDALADLLLTGPDGTVLAASDPVRVGEVLRPPAPSASWESRGGSRVIEVALPAEGGGWLRAGLAAEPVERVLAGGRRTTVLLVALLVALALGGALASARFARHRRRREEAHAEELRRREQVASLGRLAAGVAHEIRSPLNAISMAAQRLERALPGGDEGTRGILQSVRREVARLNGIVEEFLDLGRTRALECADVDLSALLAEVVRAEAPEARLEAPQEAVRLRADAGELRKAFGNLVRNARQAAGDGAVVVAWRAEAGAAVVEVRDGGPGIPSAERERIFEHFVSRRPGGTGLGLPIARAAVERHGGWIEVGDAPEGGALFRVSLPAGGSR